MNKYEIVELENKKILAEKFDKYKNDLKIFSEQTENDLSLSRVDTDWFWGFGSHTVTGEELNKLTSQIQDYLIRFNNINNKIIKEFEAIYNTFNALDNEYIKNIMQSIMKSNEAINKANRGLIEAEKRIEDINDANGRIEVAQNNIKVIQDKLQFAQKDLDKHMEIQKKIVDGLTQFKGKIDSYKHLKDIDNMWENLEKLVNKIPTISGDINDIKRFKDRLQNYKYLENIDNMWLNLQNLDSKVPIISEDIKNLKIDTQKNEGELNDIKRFKDKLENYKHLEDIDKIWNDLDYLRVIKNKLEIVENLDKLTNDVEGLKKLNSSLELRLKNTFNFIEEQKKKIENLETNLETSQNENKSLSKKLNISYLLGGGALILSIFNTFYLFFRG
ncbi:hypothetical protein [Fusobacterium sp. HMSC064B11]|uniref:hypothetical protein n=1 Tax=Fusobacterium sp. HMSC064B11 TaxID=1739543 RepID=UPI0008A3E64E|nr:hypothetical protein [Fusobacterium sp. HMSC064B11]